MSQKIKHSPGPWYIDDSCVDIGQMAIHASTGYLVATIDRPPDGIDNDDIENAHLIATAPEMLDALVAAEQVMQAIRKTIPNADSIAIFVQRYDKVKAAIAKATGDDDA